MSAILTEAGRFSIVKDPKGQKAIIFDRIQLLLKPRSTRVNFYHGGVLIAHQEAPGVFDVKDPELNLGGIKAIMAVTIQENLDG